MLLRGFGVPMPCAKGEMGGRMLDSHIVHEQVAGVAAQRTHKPLVIGAFSLFHGKHENRLHVFPATSYADI